jgi:hypothetical protein
MTAEMLNPQLRSLIDARLDAIDRVLVQARIGWTERRNIVEEVETQIFELLTRRGPSPTEEDVLSVLAAIDPPEAYLPEEARERPVVVTATPASAAGPRIEWRAWANQTLHVARRFTRGAACVLALVIVNGIVLALIVSSDGVIPWMVTLCALAWLNYEAIRRYRAWKAANRGSLLEAARLNLAAWLLKGGAQPT